MLTEKGQVVLHIKMTCSYFDGVFLFFFFFWRVVFAAHEQCDHVMVGSD